MDSVLTRTYDCHNSRRCVATGRVSQLLNYSEGWLIGELYEDLPSQVSLAGDAPGRHALIKAYLLAIIPPAFHLSSTATRHRPQPKKGPPIFILLSTASVLSIDKPNSQTMPPFFDRVHLHQAVSSQAVPALEAIAANGNLRSLRRFERDDPPAYVSSTESEELDDVDLIPPLRGRPMPEELEAIMERPIDDDEVNRISSFLYDIARPDDFYYIEAWREQHRLDSHLPGPTPEIFRRLNGVRRQGVIVRHLVKRRWEKLGVWNPQWGLAGRKLQPGDNFRRWVWWWQPEGAADDPNRACDDARELVARALRLRQNLRRGEHAPVLPRSRLGQDTSAAQAEAFLISRPWFVFQIELAEEKERYDRLSVEDQRRYPYSAQNQVIKWWKERGDWRDEFNRTSWVTAWKWGHESPSPEPEDLTPVDNMRDSPLEAAEDMEFTCSEIDELETIDLPGSEQPEGFWVIEPGDLPPSFPGQMCDDSAEIAKREKARAEKARAEGRERKMVDPVIQAFMERFHKGPGPFRLFGPPQPLEHRDVSPEEHGDAPSEPQKDASESGRDTACPPPQKQRRLRQRQLRAGVDRAQDQNQILPPSRRSARITGIKRPAEPLLSQTAPNKKPRGSVPKAAAPAAAPAAQPPLRNAPDKRSHDGIIDDGPLSKRYKNGRQLDCSHLQTPRETAMIRQSQGSKIPASENIGKREDGHRTVSAVRRSARIAAYQEPPKNSVVPSCSVRSLGRQPRRKVRQTPIPPSSTGLQDQSRFQAAKTSKQGSAGDGRLSQSKATGISNRGCTRRK